MGTGSGKQRSTRRDQVWKHFDSHDPADGLSDKALWRRAHWCLRISLETRFFGLEVAAHRRRGISKHSSPWRALADVWLGYCRVPKDDLGSVKMDDDWRLKLGEMEI